jgi:DNA-binding NtrC family response regulator
VSQTSDDPEPLVLLVDDDEDFLKVFALGLERSGFEVEATPSAQAAYDWVAGLERPVDVLVADINLADGWGASLALSIRQMQPDVKVVYISGYTRSDPILAQGIEDHMTFLAKPFEIEELAAAVRGALEGAGPAESTDG